MIIRDGTAGERFIALSSGNARLIRLRRQLDGPVATFGRVFWKAVGHVCDLFKEEECYNFFKAAGYETN